MTKTCGTHCQGTSYPDTLKGTNGKNHIKGLGGNESATFGDLIQGFGDNDVIHGDAGGDKIEGGPGKDLIFGDRGKDVLIGGIGNDHIDGGRRHNPGEGWLQGCRELRGGSDNVANRDSFGVL